MKEKSTMLTTERLVLKGYEESDRDAVIALLENPEITKTFMVPDFESREQADALFNRLMEISKRPDRIEYGVYLDSKLIGFVNDCGYEDGAIEIGYVIDPAYRGKGYAPEAVRAVIAEQFRMGYPRVTAGYFEENPASRRVMEKCEMHPIDKVSDDEYRGAVHRCYYMAIDAPLDGAAQ